MELKVSSADTENRILVAFGEKLNFLSDDILLSKDLLLAKVIEKLAGNNDYILNFSGKHLRLKSETKLFIGETLNLKVKKEPLHIQLEIFNRSTSIGESDKALQSAWTKNYYSPGRILEKAFEPIKTDVSLRNIFQFLEMFFPGLEWNTETPYFDWNFQDGFAEGFYGRERESFGFYLHFQSRNLGTVDSYLNWKKSDLSDLTVNCIFDKLSTYLIASESIPELKNSLNKNSITAANILFHFSSVHKSKGDWLA